MKRRICRAATALLGMAFSVMLLALTAFAGNIPSLRLSVKITAEGSLPDPAEAYTVRLTADHADSPMPNAQFGGSCDLQVNGSGDAVFPPVGFERVGVYAYTIEQLAGTNPDCRYDTRSYSVRVAVTNTETGEYDITLTLREDGMSEKPDEIEFRNVYERDDDPPVSPGTEMPPTPIVPTGVVDHWVIYLTGSALLLLVSAWIIRLLRR